MNLRIVLVCLLIIALALYTAGRGVEEQQQRSQESSKSDLNQLSWTSPESVEWDGFFQLLVYREDMPTLEIDPWYESQGGERECCPAVPPLNELIPPDLSVQEFPEKFL